MELVIPDGAQVHITIGQAPTLALSHNNPALPAKPDYRTGRIAKGLLAGVVLFGAFQAGRFLPHHPDSALAAQPTASVGTSDGGSAAEIPPAFRAQMGNAPQVVPAPGAVTPSPSHAPSGVAPAPAPASATPNPFGLQG